VEQVALVGHRVIALATVALIVGVALQQQPRQQPQQQYQHAPIPGVSGQILFHAHVALTLVQQMRFIVVLVIINVITLNQIAGLEAVLQQPLAQQPQYRYALTKQTLGLEKQLAARAINVLIMMELASVTDNGEMQIMQIQEITATLVHGSLEFVFTPNLLANAQAITLLHFQVNVTNTLLNALATARQAVQA